MTERLAAQAAKAAIDACMKAQQSTLVIEPNGPNAKGKSPAQGDVPDINNLPVLQGTPEVSKAAEISDENLDVCSGLAIPLNPPPLIVPAPHCNRVDSGRCIKQRRSDGLVESSC